MKQRSPGNTWRRGRTAAMAAVKWSHGRTPMILAASAEVSSKLIMGF